MTSLSLVLLTLLTAAPAPPSPDAAGEVLSVLAVGAAPAGPSPEVAELSHQLRAACRDRVAGVQEVAEMRARLVGATARATWPELERAYVGAQAAFQADELDSALRTLRAIVEDLERLPETADAFGLWERTQLRIALVERAARRPALASAALDRLVAVDPGVLVDPQQYPPSFRRDADEARRRVSRAPRTRLTITSNGAPAVAFVDGKEVGTTPVTVALPPGRYRIGGQAGRVRAPPSRVELAGDERRVELDVALAEAVRPDGGPGLAIGADRGSALVRAGAWLGADRVVAAAVVEDGEARLLDGALYDVRRGALLREGRVRMAGGAVSPASLGALAAFLLSGQASSGVLTVAPLASPASAAAPPALRLPAAGVAEAAPGRRAGWLRPSAYASGALALGLAGVAAWQGLAARGGYRDAAALVRPDGSLVAGADRAGYDRAVASADASRRNAYLAAAGTAVFAATAGILGYLSWEPGGGAVVRF